MTSFDGLITLTGQSNPSTSQKFNRGIWSGSPMFSKSVISCWVLFWTWELNWTDHLQPLIDLGSECSIDPELPEPNLLSFGFPSFPLNVMKRDGQYWNQESIKTAKDRSLYILWLTPESGLFGVVRNSLDQSSLKCRCNVFDIWVPKMVLLSLSCSSPKKQARSVRRKDNPTRSSSYLGEFLFQSQLKAGLIGKKRARVYDIEMRRGNKKGTNAIILSLPKGTSLTTMMDGGGGGCRSSPI